MGDFRDSTRAASHFERISPVQSEAPELLDPRILREFLLRETGVVIRRRKRDQEQALDNFKHHDTCCFAA